MNLDVSFVKRFHVIFGVWIGGLSKRSPIFLLELLNLESVNRLT